MTPLRELTRPARLRDTARLIIDADGRIQEASAAAHRLLGYEAGSIVGLWLSWMTPPSSHGLLEQLSEALRNASELRLTSVLLRDDGSPLPVVVSTQPSISVRGRELALMLELDAEATTVVAPPASKTFPRLPTASRTEAPATQRPPPPRGSARPKRRQRDSLPRKVEPSPVLRTEVSERLDACIELLRWLHSQLHRRGTRHIARDRALSRMVLREASALLEQCRADLNSTAAPEEGGEHRR